MIWVTRASDPLTAGDRRLGGRLAGLVENLPLDGFAEEFDHAGCLGLLGRFQAAPGLRQGTDAPIGGHPDA